MYSDFLNTYKAHYLKIGIPLESLESQRNFEYLIEHGYCNYTAWNTESLSYYQLKSLSELTSAYTIQCGLDNVLGDILSHRLLMIEQNLEKLDYTIHWMEFGVLGVEELDDQISIYNQGEDRHTEHYRYKTLKAYIAQKTDFTTVQIENIISLALNDKDKLMSSSVPVELLRKNVTTNEQTEKLAIVLRTYGTWTEKVLARIDIKNRQLPHSQ